MRKFFSNIWRFLKEKCALAQVFFQVKIDGLRLQLAIYMANALQKARNKRFYVIENAKGNLIWLCNDDIKEMKKPKKVRKLVDGKLRTFKFWMLDPNKNGITVEERNKKQQKWLAYMEKIRMDRIFGKYKLK